MPPPTKIPTPYGGRLIWKLPGGNNLVVHLKDKLKIRLKKRWSQVELNDTFENNLFKHVLMFVMEHHFFNIHLVVVFPMQLISGLMFDNR